MSHVPASPPSVARWSFFLGATAFLAVGTAVLLLADPPLGLGTLLILVLCLSASFLLCCIPYVLEFDARVRLAEAHARENIDGQVRRLGQSVAQLGNSVSRAQSADDQTSRAVAALEEMAEKFSQQADELAQSLARAYEREVAALQADLAALRTDRDDRLAALEQRLDVANGQVSELQLQTRKAAATAAKALDEIKARLAELAMHLEDRARLRTPLSGPPPATPPTDVPDQADEPMADAEDAVAKVEDTANDAADEPATRGEEEKDAEDATGDEPEASSRPASSAAKKTATRPKPRARRAPESGGIPPSRISARPQPLELPLLDVPATSPQPSFQRDASAGASTLVATAYIGIGNKLYIRGDGPGLSWEQGVPMQFLAIGKWGWTSPAAQEPITCRIYRNDETPMLDDNVVIEPGTRAEITPRF